MGFLNLGNNTQPWTRPVGRSADVTFDANGIGRDNQGNVVAADPNNPAVKAQLAAGAGTGATKGTTTIDAQAAADTFHGVTTAVHSVIDDIQHLLAPPKPQVNASVPVPDNSHRNLILGLLAAAAIVYVVKHHG